MSFFNQEAKNLQATSNRYLFLKASNALLPLENAH